MAHTTLADINAALEGPGPSGRRCRRLLPEQPRRRPDRSRAGCTSRGCGIHRDQPGLAILIPASPCATRWQVWISRSSKSTFRIFHAREPSGITPISRPSPKASSAGSGPMVTAWHWTHSNFKTFRPGLNPPTRAIFIHTSWSPVRIARSFHGSQKTKNPDRPRPELGHFRTRDQRRVKKKSASPRTSGTPPRPPPIWSAHRPHTVCSSARARPPAAQRQPPASCRRTGWSLKAMRSSRPWSAPSIAPAAPGAPAFVEVGSDRQGRRHPVHHRSHEADERNRSRCQRRHQGCSGRKRPTGRAVITAKPCWHHRLKPADLIPYL